MSDLSATNCGCRDSREGSGRCSCLIWLIILFAILGNNDGCGGGGMSLFGGDSDSNCGCNIIILLLLLSSCGCGCGSIF